MSKRKYITEDQRLTADAQIKSLQRQINYDTKDYTVELVVQKFKKDEFFIPDYQRGFVWKEKNKSSFIESVLLGLPIPFMFFADCEDGKLEIIDGAQRVQTLVAFVTGKLVLSQLPKLSALHGFRFDDLSEAQKRRFWNRPLRIVVLEESTPKDVRQDIFNRINTSGIKAKESEIRRGSYPGRLTDYIDACSANERFVKLCPVTDAQEIRRERFELLLRFFAYSNCYLEFDHAVKDFLDEFLIKNQDTFDEAAYTSEFTAVLTFVENNFPFGFAKTKTSKITPRVRFDCKSVSEKSSGGMDVFYHDFNVMKYVPKIIENLAKELGNRITESVTLGHIENYESMFTPQRFIEQIMAFEYLFEKLEPEKAEQRNFHLIDELELMLGVFPDVIAGVRKSTRKIADEIKNLRVDIVHGHAYYYDFANDHNIQYYMLMLDKLIERMNLKLVGFNDEEIKTFCSY